MRLIGRLLAWTAGLAVVVALGLWLAAGWRHAGSAATGDAAVAGTTRALAYVLAGDRWLAFPLEVSAGKHLRIVTNANVTPAAAAIAGELFEYALEYQLHDDTGREIASGSHFHRTEVTRAAAAVAAFYHETALVPADGRILELDFATAPAVATLRLRVSAAGSAVGDTAVRVYQRERLADFKLANRWQRIGEEQRAALARGNVYPEEFLTSAERLALVRYRWNPTAPRGVEGADFEKRTLYQRRETADAPVRETILPHGLLVETGTRGTLAVPAPGGTVTYEFEPIDARGPLQLSLSWRGDDAHDRARQALRVAPPLTVVNLDYRGGGLVEIAAERAVAVRALLAVPGRARIDITPAPRYQRGYLVGPGETVEYALTHIAGEATPVRIETRLLLAAGEPRGSGSLAVDYRGADGAAGRAPPCVFEVPAAVYARAELAAAHDGQQLSDAASCYFRVPAGVRKIRLSAPHASIVTAATRPPGLVKTVEVPDDYAAFQGERLPVAGWFPLQPEDRERLARTGRRVLVTTQTRPAEDDVELLAGRFRWEEFRPQGHWTARYLFGPRDTTLPLRDAALGSAYRAVPANARQRIEVRGVPGQRSVVPGVVFINPRQGEFDAGFEVDGREVVARRLSGERGEFHLPALAPGTHELRIRAPADVEWYVNHLAGNGAVQMRRLATRIGRQPITFAYTKRAPAEVLIARLQMPAAAPVPAVVRVIIDARRAPRSTAMNAVDAWTFLDRRFVVHPDISRRVPVLGDRAFVDLGRRLFVPLNADLPAGNYAVTVWMENADQGYLSLYRLTPGRHEEERLLKEESVIEGISTGEP